MPRSGSPRRGASPPRLIECERHQSLAPIPRAANEVDISIVDGTVCRLSPRVRLVRRRLSDQFGWFNAENDGKTLDHINAGGINAPLKRAHVCSVDIGAMRKFFLRQVLFPPQAPQIRCQCFSSPHGAEHRGLSSISPRSILYKAPLRRHCACHECEMGSYRDCRSTRTFSYAPSIWNS